MTARAATLVVLAMLGLVLGSTEAAAQRTCQFAVPPSGASIDVALHPAYVTSIDIWENLREKASGSLGPPNYEVRPMSARTLLIRPLRLDAPPGNITLPTVSGVKVVVAVTVIADATLACSLVTVELVTEAEAFQRRVDDEVARQTATMAADLATMRAELADRVRAGIDQELATRALTRRSLVSARSIARSPDDLVVRVGQVLYLGDGAIVAFEIQNRRRATVSLAAVALRGRGDGDLAAAVALEGGPSPDGIGRVAGNGVTRGVLVVRSVASVRGANLTLIVTPAAGPTVRVPGMRLE